jgi:hypothetical protein
MPFIGTLRDNEHFTVDVTATVPNNGSTALTVTYLNPTGNRIRDIDISTGAGGVPVVVSRVIPRNTTRIYIEIDLPDGGLAQARITQGIFVHTSDISFDSRLVFDVV